MRIRFLVTTPVQDGGLALATRRLALALLERGHSCEILLPDGPSGRFEDVPYRMLSALAVQKPVVESDELVRQLGARRSDLIIVSEARTDLLRAASQVAPTLLHSHVHGPVCPEASRYWGRVERECAVQAGWKCLALRPTLGCSGRRRVLSWKPVAERQALAQLLSEGTIGIIGISSHQAELFCAHGLPPTTLTVIPNLGARFTADELHEAAVSTQPHDRGAVAYFGRLTKEKGGRLLVDLEEGLEGLPLAVFGEGYLEQELRLSIASSLRGHVTQERVAGVLQWARAVVFPSLWPEPGGLVGIDAQLFGVPLAAFKLGSALDWPQAVLFPPRDVRQMAAWARSQAEPTMPRSPEVIAEAQARYWSQVGFRAETSLSSFCTSGRFESPGVDAVLEDLTARDETGVFARKLMVPW